MRGLINGSRPPVAGCSGLPPAPIPRQAYRAANTRGARAPSPTLHARARSSARRAAGARGSAACQKSHAARATAGATSPSAANSGRSSAAAAAASAAGASAPGCCGGAGGAGGGGEGTSESRARLRCCAACGCGAAAPPPPPPPPRAASSRCQQSRSSPNSPARAAGPPRSSTRGAMRAAKAAAAAGGCAGSSAASSASAWACGGGGGGAGVRVDAACYPFATCARKRQVQCPPVSIEAEWGKASREGPRGAGRQHSRPRGSSRLGVASTTRTAVQTSWRRPAGGGECTRPTPPAWRPSPPPLRGGRAGAARAHAHTRSGPARSRWAAPSTAAPARPSRHKPTRISAPRAPAPPRLRGAPPAPPRGSCRPAPPQTGRVSVSRCGRGEGAGDSWCFGRGAPLLPRAGPQRQVRGAAGAPFGQQLQGHQPPRAVGLRDRLHDGRAAGTAGAAGGRRARAWLKAARAHARARTCKAPKAPGIAGQTFWCHAARPCSVHLCAHQEQRRGARPLPSKPAPLSQAAAPITRWHAPPRLARTHTHAGAAPHLHLSMTGGQCSAAPWSSASMPSAEPRRPAASAAPATARATCGGAGTRARPRVLRRGLPAYGQRGPAQLAKQQARARTPVHLVCGEVRRSKRVRNGDRRLAARGRGGDGRQHPPQRGRAPAARAARIRGARGRGGRAREEAGRAAEGQREGLAQRAAAAAAVEQPPQAHPQVGCARGGGEMGQGGGRRVRARVAGAGFCKGEAGGVRHSRRGERSARTRGRPWQCETGSERMVHCRELRAVYAAAGAPAPRARAAHACSPPSARARGAPPPARAPARAERSRGPRPPRASSWLPLTPPRRARGARATGRVAVRGLRARGGGAGAGTDWVGRRHRGALQGGKGVSANARHAGGGRSRLAACLPSSCT